MCHHISCQSLKQENSYEFSFFFSEITEEMKILHKKAKFPKSHQKAPLIWNCFDPKQTLLLQLQAPKLSF